MVVETIPLFGPVPGGMELAVILLIAVLLFGANKIPKLARSTGEAMGEFKKGRQEVETELREMQESDSSASETESDSAVEADAEV
ncbi:Sec-independent protein translocase subunit TatA/TatB [Haladaptatus sp. NG-SE-30]